MEKFFKDKKNLILVILLGVSLLSVGVAALVEALMPLSCIIFGITCLYGAYLMFLIYRKKKRNNFDEFMSEEDTLKRRTTQFLQSESKINTLLLVIMFAVLGVILIYYGIKVFIM